ncbi:unnamed protein product [Schistosoma turkestanicum]|nr:unnamed protein product [Schistosoma turkestanicum]
MILVFSIVIINMIFTIESNKLSDPNCRCFVFDSAMHKSGIFKTPNYPKNYQYELDCLLYYFHGLSTELVKITFTTFNLRKPIEKKCIDYLDIFTTIESNDHTMLENQIMMNENMKLSSKSGQPMYNLSVNFPRPADYRLCGDLNDFPQNDFYSVSSILLLIFHTAPKIPGLKRSQQMGFIGQFTFDLKTNYQNNEGRRKENTFCDYEFSPMKLSNKTIKYGEFFSPFYPSNYPPNIKCRFIFKADKKERIILTFRSIRLKAMTNGNLGNNHTKRCSTRNSIPVQSDFISISEMYKNKSRTLANLCTNLVNIQLVSHGSMLKLDFVSRSPFYQGQGFHGTYEFVHESQVLPSPFLKEDDNQPVENDEHENQYLNYKNNKDKLENSSNSNKSKLFFADAEFTSSRNMQFREAEDSSYLDYMNFPYSNQFNNEIKSNHVQRKLIVSKGPINHTQGIIYSPRFPQPYPSSFKAMYTFIGQSMEIVLVKFLFLELGNSNSCENRNKSMGDRVQLYDGMHTEDPLIIEYCENKIVYSNQQKTYTTFKPEYFISSKNIMTVLFKSDEISRPNELGFKLFYSFEQQDQHQQRTYEKEKYLTIPDQTVINHNKPVNCSKIAFITEIYLILPIIICFQLKENR